jgi:hypothetical protein
METCWQPFEQCLRVKRPPDVLRRIPRIKWGHDESHVSPFFSSDMRQDLYWITPIGITVFIVIEQ